MVGIRVGRVSPHSKVPDLEIRLILSVPGEANHSGLAGEMVLDRLSLTTHRTGVTAVSGDLPNNHALTLDLDHLVKVNIGLVITPGGAVDVTNLGHRNRALDRLDLVNLDIQRAGMVITRAVERSITLGFPNGQDSTGWNSRAGVSGFVIVEEGDL